MGYEDGEEPELLYEEEEEEEEEDVEEEEEEVVEAEEDIAPSPTEEQDEVDKLVERDILTLRMISTEYRDIPDAVKFQWKRDCTVLTDVDREFINRGHTFHARKARRHRLRRWQEEMARCELVTVLQAMDDHHDDMMARTRRFMRNHGVAVPF